MRAPLLLRALAFATIALSGVVLFEPAPTDLLFLPLFGCAIVMRAMRFRGAGVGFVFGLAVFLWASIASLMVATRAIDSVRYFAITLYLGLLTLTFAGLIGRYGPGFLRLCLRAYCYAALLVAIIGVLARFSIIPPAMFTDRSGLRLQSTFKDANVFAPFVGAAILVVLNDFLARRRGGLATVGYLSIYTTTMLFAFSRGAFANLFLALLTYAALCIVVVRDGALSRRLVGILGLGGAVAVVVTVAALSFTDLGEFTDQRLAMQRYDTERFAQQAAVWQIAAEHPLGVGPGEFKLWAEIDPHNVYLRILAENGLLAVLGFVLLAGACVFKGVGGVLRRTVESPTHAMAVAVLVGILAESVVIDTLHWRHLFLFLAIPVGLRIHSRVGTSRARAVAPYPLAAGLFTARR